MIGEKYNLLTITKILDPIVYPYKSYKMVEAKCDCGKIITSRLANIKNGNTKSCGCYRKYYMSEIKVIHKDCRRGKETSEHRTLDGMKQRCYNINNHKYPLYGQRGIIICDQWLEKNGQGYINFLNDMGRKPSSEYSIDRINVDGNYEPSNCRWATKSEQVKNRRPFKRKK
jgi:hypothetical protein